MSDHISFCFFICDLDMGDGRMTSTKKEKAGPDGWHPTSAQGNS